MAKQIQEMCSYEPQAFIADPDHDYSMVQVSKGQLESLRSGDTSTQEKTWGELEEQFRSRRDYSEPNQTNKAKAGFLTEIEPSQASQRAWDNAYRVWEDNGAIAPPFAKDLLVRISRMSGVLNECIRTYRTVIDGFGYTFIPTLDPDSDDAFEQVKWSIWSKRVDEGNEPESSEPTDQEVEDKLAEIRRDIRFEKMKAERFFTNAGRINGEPVGFIQLRQRSRDDYEKIGEFYWEVLRDQNGDIRRLNYVPSIGIRKMPLDKDKTEVSVTERIDGFTLTKTNEYRTFRRFIQVDPEDITFAYFKEFGDPRVVSGSTGYYYSTVEELKKAEPTASPANELITDGIPDPETPYGIPRWISNSPAIGGSRKAEEVNFSYFDNKTIPPFLILVSGGRLSSQAQDRIKTYLRTLKGSDNFHKLLVLEAAPFTANLPGQPPQRVQIEVVPLIKFMQDDGLFLKYLAFNDTRIGANFACPSILRGRSEEYVRSVAREALRFFETMVAEPERIRFDEQINLKIMAELGITLVKFRSLGADTSDPEVMAKVLDVLLKHGAIVPDDARVDAEKLLHRELPKINQDFMKVPLKMTVAEIATSANRPDEQSPSQAVPKPEADQAKMEDLYEDEELEDEDDELDELYLDLAREAIKRGVKGDLFAKDKMETWTGMDETEK